jgi:hypothetical protein
MHEPREKTLASSRITLDEHRRQPTRAFVPLQKGTDLLPKGDDLWIFAG